jgi:hypothetical protein
LHQAAVGGWSEADKALEDAAEVALVGEAGLEGDLRERRRGAGELPAGPVSSPPANVIAGGAVKCRRKAPAR